MPTDLSPDVIQREIARMGAHEGFVALTFHASQRSNDLAGINLTVIFS
jgi:hypothetical protein